MNNVTLITWDDRHAQDFISLSMEWLEKYKLVEPADLEIINNPHKMILDQGGQIFFAQSDGKSVGTVAMIRQDPHTFELAKLAVTEEYKGRKIGDLLVEQCVAFAREQNVEKIILYTNKLLQAAIGLYKKYGFIEIPLVSNKYIESDMKMELQVK